MHEARNRISPTYDARKALEIYPSLPPFHQDLQKLMVRPGLSATPFVLSPVEAQPLDGAQAERESWLIRAGAIMATLQTLIQSDQIPQSRGLTP